MNMGYCRFENTLKDLQDCEDHLDEELSETEELAREELFSLIREIAIGYDLLDE